MATIKRNAGGSILHNMVGKVVNTCGAPACSNCTGTPRNSKTVTFIGTITKTGCSEEYPAALRQVTVTQDGACQYRYSGTVCGGPVDILLSLFATETVVTWTGTSGNSNWTKSQSLNYNCNSDVNGLEADYPLTLNGSGEFDFSATTVEVSD